MGQKAMMNFSSSCSVLSWIIPKNQQIMPRLNNSYRNIHQFKLWGVTGNRICSTAHFCLLIFYSSSLLQRDVLASAWCLLHVGVSCDHSMATKAAHVSSLCAYFQTDTAVRDMTVQLLRTVSLALSTLQFKNGLELACTEEWSITLSL